MRSNQAGPWNVLIYHHPKVISSPKHQDPILASHPYGSSQIHGHLTTLVVLLATPQIHRSSKLWTKSLHVAIPSNTLFPGSSQLSKRNGKRKERMSHPERPYDDDGQRAVRGGCPGEEQGISQAIHYYSSHAMPCHGMLPFVILLFSSFVAFSFLYLSHPFNYGGEGRRRRSQKARQGWGGWKPLFFRRLFLSEKKINYVATASFAAAKRKRAFFFPYVKKIWIKKT